MNSAEIVDRFLGKQFLIGPDLFDCYDGDETFLDAFSKDRPLVITKDLFSILRNNGVTVPEINWVEFEKSRAFFEKGKEHRIYSTFLDILA